MRGFFTVLGRMGDIRVVAHLRNLLDIFVEN
jgi:hypothetical protein